MLQRIEDIKEDTLDDLIATLQRAQLQLLESIYKALLVLKNKDKVILDSITTNYIFNNDKHFLQLSPYTINIGIRKGKVVATSYGTVQLDFKGTRQATLTKALYVPDLVANLVSTKALRLKGVFYRNNTQILFTQVSGKEQVATYIYVSEGLPYLQLKGTTIPRQLLY